jgi:DnaA family protein
MSAQAQLVLALSAPPAPSLENFFAGSNAVALGAVRSLLAGDERVLYLWGESGSGKSHLLQAAAAAASRQTTSTATALHTQDDVEQLDLVAQLELFDLFNSLRLHGGQLLVSADRPPTDLPLREDLRTRLGSGVVLQLRPLSEDEKQQALQAQAARAGFSLDTEVMQFLLQRFGRDMRSLSAAVAALDQLSLSRQRPVNLTLAREVLRQLKP